MREMGKETQYMVDNIEYKVNHFKTFKKTILKASMIETYMTLTAA